MSWLERVGTKVRLRMTSWISTLFLIGVFISVYMHQVGYVLDTTILSIFATGAVGIVTSLFNIDKRHESVEVPPITQNSTCFECGKPLNK